MLSQNKRHVFPTTFRDKQETLDALAFIFCRFLTNWPLSNDFTHRAPWTSTVPKWSALAHFCRPLNPVGTCFQNFLCQTKVLCNLPAISESLTLPKNAWSFSLGHMIESILLDWSNIPRIPRITEPIPLSRNQCQRNLGVSNNEREPTVLAPLRFFGSEFCRKFIRFGANRLS